MEHADQIQPDFLPQSGQGPIEQVHEGMDVVAFLSDLLDRLGAAAGHGPEAPTSTTSTPTAPTTPEGSR